MNVSVGIINLIQRKIYAKKTFRIYHCRIKISIESIRRERLKLPRSHHQLEYSQTNVTTILEVRKLSKRSPQKRLTRPRFLQSTNHYSHSHPTHLMQSNQQAGPSTAPTSNIQGSAQQAQVAAFAENLDNSLIVAARAITFVVLANPYEKADTQKYPQNYQRWCMSRSKDITRGAIHCLRCFSTEEAAVATFNRQGEYSQATLEWLFSKSHQEKLPNFYDLCCRKIVKRRGHYQAIRDILHVMGRVILDLQILARQSNLSSEYDAIKWLNQFYEVFNNDEKRATPNEVRQRRS